MIEFYMDVALRTAELSTAEKLKVGTIIVKDDNIISFSWNGTVPNFHTNQCEDEYFDPITNTRILQTKDEVVHSEANAILKLAKNGISAKNAALFCTVAPCIECSKMIITAGISTVYYKHEYKTAKGIDFMTSLHINVIKV